MKGERISKKAVRDSLKEALGEESPAVEMILKNSERRNREQEKRAGPQPRKRGRGG